MFSHGQHRKTDPCRAIASKSLSKTLAKIIPVDYTGGGFNEPDNGNCWRTS